jgi:hypothetical protein
MAKRKETPERQAFQLPDLLCSGCDYHCSSNPWDLSNGERGICTTVRDHLRNTNWQQITDMTIKATDNYFLTFIHGSNNHFLDLEFVYTSSS